MRLPKLLQVQPRRQLKKNEMGIYQYYKGAPPVGKIAMIGGFIALGVTTFVVGRSIVRRIQHQKDLKGQRQVVDDSKTVVKQLEAQGKGPSYPDAQYSSWASSIQAGFDGCDVGNNDDIAAVMNAANGIRTEADVYKLISTFGVRKWDECGWLTGDVEKDLVGGIRYEISQRDINIINNTLRNKGIIWQV